MATDCTRTLSLSDIRDNTTVRLMQIHVKNAIEIKSNAFIALYTPKNTAISFISDGLKHKIIITIRPISQIKLYFVSNIFLRNILMKKTNITDITIIKIICKRIVIILKSTHLFIFTIRGFIAQSKMLSETLII